MGARILQIFLKCILITEGIRVLSTDRDLALHTPNSRAELLHSSLARQDTVTICARLSTYQFTHQGYGWWPAQVFIALADESLFESGAMIEEKPAYKPEAGELWQNGDVIITADLGTVLPARVDWRPGVWNNVCIMLSGSRKIWQVVFNGKTVIMDNMYNGYHMKKEKNLNLMGLSSEEEYGSAFGAFGAITDLSIWNRSLAEVELAQWNQCKLQARGNLLDWASAHWNVQGLQEVEMNYKEVCWERKSTTHLVFRRRENFNSTLNLCRSLGGGMFSPNDKGFSMQAMIKSVSKVRAECGNLYFLGITDEIKEGVWVDVDTGENITEIPEWFPTNVEGENCAVFNADSRQNLDNTCSYEYCPVCEVPEMTAFHLQGVCKDSLIDRFYVLLTPTELLGYIQNKMIWSEVNYRWEIIKITTNETMAYMNATSFFPFATHPWYFVDGSECSDQGQNWRKLNFHLKVKQPGNICCDDGTCVNSNWKCDGEIDCKDSSDEKNCEMIVVHSTYSNQIPSRPYDGFRKNPLNLNVETTIINIFDFDEAESIFILSFVLEVKWRDRYLEYNFLNSDPKRNVVTDDEKNKIWIPSLQFLTVSEKDITTRNFFVEKISKPSMPDEVNETYFDAMLTIELVVKASFICSFENIKFYPFGTQKCSFNLFIPGIDNYFTNIVPGKFLDVGPKTVGDFQILQWTVQNGAVISENQKHFNFSYKKAQNDVGLIYTVYLSRNIWSIILVTYLPTLLMNIINQATNYISSPDKYETIFEINVTCMMVLSSIYLAVSASLPTTAEIKPVQIWLLVSLVYPVLVIVLNILIQVVFNLKHWTAS